MSRQSSKDCTYVFGESQLSNVGVPPELLSDHVEEGAPEDILPLQPAGQYIGRDQTTASGNDPGVLDQVVVAPAAAIDSLPVPAHSCEQALDHSAQLEERAVEFRKVTTHPRKPGDVRAMPAAAQRVGDESEEI